jgi:hypothetical protein
MLACCAAHAVLAEPQRMTREQILDIAKTGVDYGYKWGFAHWNSDGSGKDVHACSTAQCTNCCCVKLANNGSSCSSGMPATVDGCKNYYPAGGPGADCSGYVAKCWQIPDASSVETNRHPYTTKSFFQSNTHWTEIEFSDLKAGDAMVKWAVTTNESTGEQSSGGHIVLFNAAIDPAKYQYDVYEAAGCKQGIRHGATTLNDKWKAIRRNDVVDFECTDNACNGHGECSESTGCTCQPGYAGKACDRCEQGYVGYPSCVRADSMCKLSGTISCEMKPIPIAPQLSDRRMDSYACGASGLAGGELAFRFDPARAGKATLRIGSPDGKARLLVLRGACDPAGCIAASDKSLEFDFADNEVFFVVVDTSADANQDVTLSVDCKRPETAFIGDPCNDAGDCTFENGKEPGFCYDTGSGGFCSLACSKFCPDVSSSKASTFCIADPRNSAAGICVPKPDPLNQDCAALSGTGKQTAMRFNDTASSLACVPGAKAPACSGGFSGRVTDAKTGAPLAHTMVAVEGATGMMLETDANGQYATANMPCGKYTLRTSANGYAPVTSAVQVTSGTQTQMTALPAVASAQCSDTGVLRGLVFDAVSQERRPISGASVNVSAGLGQGIGPIAFDVVSDSNGMYVAEGIPTGTYTVTASSTGYQPGMASLGICGGAAMETRDIGLVRTSDLPLRVVLRWNRPSDLDLHVQTPQADEIYFYTPCRGALERAPFAQLDVDRRKAEGPEVISASRLLPGRYTVFVHNYSQDNDKENVPLTDSAAEVTAYGPGERVLGTFSVPVNGTGTSWDVFSFDGSDPSKLTSIQRLTNRPNPETDYSEDCIP